MFRTAVSLKGLIDSYWNTVFTGACELEDLIWAWESTLYLLVIGKEKEVYLGAREFSTFSQVIQKCIQKNSKLSGNCWNDVMTFT
jgi:hypothetical protein